MRPPTAEHLVVLEHAEQLRLRSAAAARRSRRGRRCPPCAASKSPPCRVTAPVKAPLHVPEELALQQRLGERRAVAAARRVLPRAARRRGSARASDSLPTPVSPCRRIATGAAAACSARRYTSLCAGRAHDGLHRELRVRLRLRLRQLVQAPEPRPDRREELGAREGLRQVVVGAELHAHAHVGAGGLRAQEDEGDERGLAALAERLQHRVAVRSRHGDVAEHEVRPLASPRARRPGCRPTPDHVEALDLEQISHVLADVCVVLDHQDSLHRSLPSEPHGELGALVHLALDLTRPPCASAASFTMASPRPVPGMVPTLDPRWNLPKRRSRSSRGCRCLRHDDEGDLFARVLDAQAHVLRRVLERVREQVHEDVRHEAHVEPNGPFGPGVGAEHALPVLAVRGQASARGAP